MKKMHMDSWFDTVNGKTVIEIEKKKCEQLIPTNYYARSLQIGLPRANYLEKIAVSSYFFSSSNIQNFHCYPVNDKNNRSELSTNEKSVPNNYVIASSDALPFPEKSCDLIILPHILDFCSSPHDILRQVNQILIPEGCIVIIGFNKLGSYSVLKWLENFSGKQVWEGEFYRVGQVQDWLALLGIDIVGASMVDYGLPVNSEKWRNRFIGLEQAGNRWWPGFGGIYVIVGKKRQMMMTIVRKPILPWRKLLPGMPQPAHQQARTQ